MSKDDLEKRCDTVTSPLLTSDLPQGSTDSNYSYTSKYMETFAPKIEKSSSWKWKSKEEVAKKRKMQSISLWIMWTTAQVTIFWLM